MEARHLLYIARMAFGDVMSNGRTFQQKGGEEGAKRSKGGHGTGERSSARRVGVISLSS